jgi:hypothetical protein
MLRHTVRSQLFRIRQADLAQSALERDHRYLIIPSPVGQNLIIQLPTIPSQKTLSPQLYNGSYAYKQLSLNQWMKLFLFRLSKYGRRYILLPVLARL